MRFRKFSPGGRLADDIQFFVKNLANIPDESAPVGGSQVMRRGLRSEVVNSSSVGLPTNGLLGDVNLALKPWIRTTGD
jgi:hypothetical protein